MTTVVFLGPTLPRDRAAALLDAVFLPPARRGDLLTAMRDHDPDTIAIVDGYFEQVPSVWHKEILFALAHGIQVAGAASMGALRAAELQSFGMTGIGRIFEAYATGRFDPFPEPFQDDDEVAVTHGPAEMGYPSTDAMVDIRATLAAAMAAAIVDEATGLALAALAKALFYKERTYPALLDRAKAAGLDAAALARLEAWLPENRVPQKRLDAEALLEGLAAGSLHTPLPAFRFERTLHFEQALARLDEVPMAAAEPAAPELAAPEMAAPVMAAPQLAVPGMAAP